MCIRKTRHVITGFLVINWVLNFSFFMAMWAVGWANGYASQWLTVTFSEMMEHTPLLKTLYISWWVIYLVLSMAIVALVLSYTAREHTQQYNGACPNLLVVVTSFYVFAVFIKLLTLLAIPLFDVDGPHSYMHGACAASAFICGLLACLFLCIRRFILVFYFTNKEDVRYYYLARCALWFNLFWIFIGLGIIIGFAITVGGAWEFFLSMFIVSDPLFQIGDFGMDPQSLQKHPGLFQRLEETYDKELK